MDTSKVDTLESVSKLVASGRAAIVPLAWLTKLLGTGGKDNAVRRREKAKAEGSRERLYVAASDKDNIRGRATAKAVWAFVKSQGEKGVTQAQIASEMKMPLSTVAYTLRGLTKKHAVKF